MPRTIERRWERPGQPVRTFEAFVPDPIGALTADLSGAVLQQAEAAAIELARVDAHLPVAWEPFARLLLRAEGLASSDIEGLRVSPRRLLEATQSAADQTARWVLANLEALDLALKSSAQPLSLDLICDWHRRLMENSPLPDRYVGRLRTEEGWIGGTSPLDAVYVPSPPELVPGLMEDLVVFCNRRDLPTVVQAAIAHAQFETIHPFGDGNGRIGRILVAWLLRSRQVVKRVIPPISPIIARRPDDYIVGLYQYRKGEVDPWVEWFAQVCLEAAAHVAGLVDKVEALIEHWDQTLGTRADAAARRLLRALPATPMIDSASAAAAVGVSRRAALTALNELEAAGIVERIELSTVGAGRPRKKYLAVGVVRLMEG